jgi:outer membrane lipoprotein-sorting protein
MQEEAIMDARYTRWLGAAAALAVLGVAGDARSDAAGDKVLAQMDAALNRAKSHYFEYDAVTAEAGKAEKKIGMKWWVKGEKQLIEFTAPADMKGTKVLILSPTEAYVYLPAFGKIRRIAAHSSSQGFLGLAFSIDDLATSKYSGQYSAAMGAEGASATTLVATPKSGQEAAYAKIGFTVAKDKFLPTEIKYFNKEGKNTKTETRGGYTCEGNICTPGGRKMVDDAKGLTTTFTRKKWKVNESIQDDVFSKRNLEK